MESPDALLGYINIRDSRHQAQQKLQENKLVIRTLVSLCALASVVLFIGCSTATTTESNRTIYDSPESVFEAFASAGKEGQWEKFANTLTPESQEMFATIMMFPASMLAATDKAAENEINSILESHGIDAEDESAEPDLGQIENIAGFISDLMAVLAKQDNGESKFAIPNGDLKDVKIEDDTATAMLDDEPIEFKKIDGGWLVHFDMSN